MSTTTTVDELRFQFQWNQAEHVRLIRAVTRHRQGGRWFRWLGPALVVGISGFVLLLPVLHPGGDIRPVWRAFAPWLLILLTWLLLLEWGLPYANALSFRRHNHCAQHPMRRVVTADGVRAECETTTSAVTWSGIHHVTETSEFFLFYLTPSCAFQLPTRAIGSAAALNSLRSVLRAHLGLRAHLLDREGSAAEGVKE